MTAEAVQRLWLEGRRDEAASQVPDELVLGTNLLGTEAMVRERIRSYRRARNHRVCAWSRTGRRWTSGCGSLARVSRWSGTSDAEAAPSPLERRRV